MLSVIDMTIHLFAAEKLSLNCLIVCMIVIFVAILLSLCSLYHSYDYDVLVMSHLRRTFDCSHALTHFALMHSLPSAHSVSGAWSVLAGSTLADGVHSALSLAQPHYPRA